MATKSDGDHVIVMQDGPTSPSSEVSNQSELLTTIAELRRQLADAQSQGGAREQLDPVFEDCPWSRSSAGSSQNHSWNNWWSSSWKNDEWQRGDSWSWKQGHSWNSSASHLYKEPPTFPGWNHMKTWDEEMRRWRQKTYVRADEQAELILRGFSYEMRKLIGLSSEQIDSSDGFDLVMNRVWVISGQKAEEEMEKILLTALCAVERTSAESLTAYVERRIQDVRRVESLGVTIPSECLGVLTKHGAKMNESTLQNFKTLSRGSLQHDDVCAALRTIDTARGTPLIKAELVTNKSSVGYNRSDRGTIYIEQSGDGTGTASVTDAGETGDSDTDSEYDPQDILNLLAEYDVSEDQVVLTLAEIKDKRSQTRRKTWPENKSLKRQIRKDRGFSSKSPGVAGESRQRPFKKLSIEQLKLVTRCGKCGQKGHWHKECTATLFVYFGDWSHGTDDLREFVESVTQSFLQVLPTHALLDTAAGQALIGEVELNRVIDEVLTPRNLRIVRREGRKLPQSSGIGGAVKPLFACFVPTMFGKSAGIIEFIVLPGSVPPILPAGLIRALGADIITSKSRVNFAQLGQDLPIHYYPSEHMSVEVFPPELKAPFSVSAGALRQFPELEPNSFDVLDFPQADSK